MSWIRVDDRFWCHPKVIRAGLEAIGLWLVACCWASTQETDGRLPADILETLPGYKKTLANRLVSVGLWDETRDVSGENLIGFEIHDYLDFNPSAEELRTKRAATAERVRRSRERNGVTNAHQEAPRNTTPVPARPGPSRPPPQESTPAVAAAPSAPRPRKAAQQSLIKAEPKTEAPTTPVWSAYAAAYERVHGDAPVRNQQVNGQLMQLIRHLGAEEAAAVAAHYLTNRAAFYVSARHPIGLLLRDYQKLRTDWATGQQISPTTARQNEQTASNAAWAYAKELEEKERKRS